MSGPGRAIVEASIIALSASLGVLACAPTEPVAAIRADVGDEIAVAVAPSELEIDFDYCQREGDGEREGAPCNLDGQVNLRLVACSATFSCGEPFLHDPETLERAATMITGFSCGFPDDAGPHDALIAYHPEVRCYLRGDLTDRTTWQPAEGIAVTPGAGEHLFFSSVARAPGDVYTNAALLMRPLMEASYDPATRRHGFCELEAWGTVSFNELALGERTTGHVSHAPAVRWRAIMQWRGDAWDCHLGDPSLTSLERVVLASETIDQPSPQDPTVLPASHGVILLSEEPLSGVEGIDPRRPQRAAALRFNRSSWFPLAPNAPPEPLVQRQLWVALPGLPVVPADLRIGKTCAEHDGERVEAIGVQVATADYVELGAIIVWPEVDDAFGGAREWDCERDESGACRLHDPRTYAEVAPCLSPSGGTP